MNTELDRQLKWIPCTLVFGILVTSLVSAADDRPGMKAAPQSTNTATNKATNKATNTAIKGVNDAVRPAVPASPTSTDKSQFQYKLTAHELDAIITKHRAIAMENESSQFDAVVVTSPTELLLMHSPTREVWGGLAAPFWAVAHPTQAWRILFPIPPE